MSFPFIKKSYFAGILAIVAFSSSLLYINFFQRGYYPENLSGGGQYRFNYRAEASEEALKARMRPQEWEEISHGSRLGFNWRAAQAQTLRTIQALHAGRGAAGARNNQYGPFYASWAERGPSKIPGRVIGSEVLPLQDRIYLLTDGGYLFRGNLSGSHWECLNDHRSLARGVNARLEVLPLPSGGNRILVGGWDNEHLGPAYLQFSDDEGLHWQTPSGIANAAWYRRTLASEDGQVWHLVRSDVSGSPEMRLYHSTDYGGSFSLLYSHPLTFGHYDRRCDMWKPADSDTIFAVFEDRFVKISPDGTATTLGVVSNQPDPEWVILTGGRSHPAAPYTFYVRIWDGTENGVYRSTDGGWNWAHFGTLTDGLHSPFSNFAFVTNPADPGKVYAGGWIVGISEDGQEWHNPHDLGGYVGYHGDVPDLNFVKTPGADSYELYIGTDGGFYKYLPQNDQFVSLTPEHLNNTQIYKMASDHTAEHRMYIGTQDNGFNFNHVPVDADSVAPFNYHWGGDVTQLVSGDGGKSFWCFWWGLGCNYVQDAASLQSSGIANWAPVYDSEYWELPAKADPQAPDECLVAGYVTPSPDGSYLVRLKAPAGLDPGELLSLEQEYGNFDFKAASGGGRIGAIGISPLDNRHIYVMTDNGVFFWSLDKGLSWQQNNTAKGKIWVRYISVSPAYPGEVFIGGAAYGSNTPCWRTTDHGQTLEPAEDPSASVLNNNRVNALCFDPEGLYVFAAADVGAFTYVIAENKWYLISGDPSPVTHFHDVEYLENSHTVRFATYARGVWDFKIQGPVTGTVGRQPAQRLNVFPNPAFHEIMLETGAGDEVSITDMEGKILYWQANSFFAPAARLRVDISAYPSGVYFVSVQQQNKAKRTGKFVKM